MYQPNFCCECGEKVIRLRWRLWNSRRFCDACAKGRRKERFARPAVAAALLICLGFIGGRAGKPPPPPLIIQRHANSPMLKTDTGVEANEKSGDKVAVVSEEVYVCGARTKKGKPCSRRVHAPGRCWQHKGVPAMLPAEKLIVKDKL